MAISKFENKWFLKIKDDLLKSFPDDFIETANFELFNLPEKPLIKGSELFGAYEIIDPDGETVLRTTNSYKIKYILYSNRNKPSQIKILSDKSKLSKAVKEYEKHLDDIIKMIVRDFKSEFPTSKRITSVSNKIFQLLNLQRY